MGNQILGMLGLFLGVMFIVGVGGLLSSNPSDHGMGAAIFTNFATIIALIVLMREEEKSIRFRICGGAVVFFIVFGWLVWGGIFR